MMMIYEFFLTSPRNEQAEKYQKSNLFAIIDDDSAGLYLETSVIVFHRLMIHCVIKSE